MSLSIMDWKKLSPVNQIAIAGVYFSNEKCAGHDIEEVSGASLRDPEFWKWVVRSKKNPGLLCVSDDARRLLGAWENGTEEILRRRSTK